MKALIWKDFRLSFGVLLTGLGFVGAPLMWIGSDNFLGWWRYGELQMPWYQVIQSSCVAGLGLSVIMAAGMAGNAVAGERPDRSAEFLACMPVSRSRLIASKIIVAAGACAFVWIVSLFLLYVLVPRLRGFGESDRWLDDGKFLLTLGGVFVSIFGAAWLGSCVLRNPSYAAGIGFLSPFAVAGVLLGGELSLGAGLVDLDAWFITFLFMTGIACFAIGTAFYLHRVEP